MKYSEVDYEWMFRSEFPAVLRTVFLILNDRAASEEITQVAFIQLLRLWGKVWRYERPDAWVRRVAMAVGTAKRERMRRSSPAEYRWVRARGAVWTLRGEGGGA